MLHISGCLLLLNEVYTASNITLPPVQKLKPGLLSSTKILTSWCRRNTNILSHCNGHFTVGLHICESPFVLGAHQEPWTPFYQSGPGASNFGSPTRSDGL